jgi:glycylpeptide N-tetradecanoyltransferase
MHSKKELQKEGEIIAFKADEQEKEPLKLPDGFKFETFDVADEATCVEICQFIEEHYVESNDFRIIYTPKKFQWALMTPGYVKEYHFVIRSTKNNKIMALMVGCPKKYMLCDRKITMLEGNFFAIHKKLRNNRLAPVMSQEMFRRQRKNGIN